MNLVENITRIRKIMNLEEQSIFYDLFNFYKNKDENSSVVEKYVSDERLVNILKNIEKNLNVKFEDKHFQNEIQLSGGVKLENGGYDEKALESFKKMKENCPSLVYDEDSYRTYERQAELFSEFIKKYGSIDGAMKLRAIPGFSQHHTGKAFDVEPITVRTCVAENAKNFGFIFPYTQDGVRMKEPWHIYFNG